MINAIREFGIEGVFSRVANVARQMNVPASLHIDYVCRVCCEVPEIAPDMNKGRKRGLLSPEMCVVAWVDKFLHGYQNRISRHESKMPGTVPDEAVGIIIKAGILNLSYDQIQQIISAHRLAMSAENILGLLLEEFLFDRLSSSGWAMAWGETVKHVDFCDKSGRLLQIKNRSNSENSSSSKIRDGKPIEKWFRVNASNGRYEWDKLRSIIGEPVANLDETSFQKFIIEVLKSNPKALAIEPDNPWLTIKS